MTPRFSALVGLFFLLPFLSLNFIVSKQIEPLFSIIRPTIHTSPFEYAMLVLVLIPILIGAFIALYPMLQKGVDGKRRIYIANTFVTFGLLAFFVTVTIALGSEIYTCDILQIPQCD